MANATPHLLPRGERLLQGTIAELLSDSATEVEVNNPPSVDELPTYFELDSSSDNPETIRVFDVSGNTIYFERGVYNSGVGREHLPNTPYKQKITSQHWKKVVDAVEQGYLPEDPSITLTRNSASEFVIEGVDRTDYYIGGRVVRFNGSDANTAAIESSILSSGDTIITLKAGSGTVPTPLESVEIAIQPRGLPYLTSLDVLDEDDMASDSATALVTQQSVKAYVDNSPDSIFRQAIINGNFDVWQRGTSFTTGVGGKYTADRWRFLGGGSTAPGSVTRQDGSGVEGSRYCIRAQRNSGETATGYIILDYSFPTEDSIKFRGNKITLSFYARAGSDFSASNNELIVQIFSGTGTDQKIADGYTGSVTELDDVASLTTSWQKFSFTIGSAFASSVSEFGFRFRFNPTGTASTNDYFDIAQVQLNAGSVALPFMPKSYEEELRACQRYYQKSYPNAIAPGSNGSRGVHLTTNLEGAVNASTAGVLIVVPPRFVVEMRTTPAVVIYSRDGTANAISVASGGTTRGGAAAAEPAETVPFRYISLDNSSATAVSAGTRVQFHYTADAEL